MRAGVTRAHTGTPVTRPGGHQALDGVGGTVSHTVLVTASRRLLETIIPPTVIYRNRIKPEQTTDMTEECT